MEGPRLFLVLEDDDCIHVYSSPEEAAIEIEALDVEGCARTMFDTAGRPYRVEWIRPNRTGKLLGLLPWARNGDYRFLVCGPADPSALLEMLSRASGIESNREADLQAVKALELRLRT